MPETKHKILVVDDDDFLRDIYVDSFKQSGFEVLEGKDGLEGLNLAMVGRPDIIFTGIIMPNMTGFEMIQQLANNVATSSIPVLVFSHLGREEDRKRAAELGARGFLVKGTVTPNEVVRTVRNILTGHVYRVAIESLTFDGPSLIKDMKCNGQAMLELTPESNEPSPNFKARFICE